MATIKIISKRVREQRQTFHCDVSEVCSHKVKYDKDKHAYVFHDSHEPNLNGTKMDASFECSLHGTAASDLVYTAMLVRFHSGASKFIIVLANEYDAYLLSATGNTIDHLV